MSDRDAGMDEKGTSQSDGAGRACEDASVGDKADTCDTASTGGKRLITAEDLLALKFVGDPQLSPDGKNVVFTLTTMDLEKNGYRTSLWMVPSDGSAAARQITGSGFEDRLVKDTSPRWSPDGTSIAFLSNRSGKNQVWLLPLQGGEARRVTRCQDAASDIAWSPDGRAIAYVAREPAEGEGAGGGAASGGAPESGVPKNKDVRVITRLRYKFDGMGFLDPRPKHIWVVDVATGASLQVTTGQFDEIAPAFSPDSKRIAFLSYREPDWELRFDQDVWVVDLETGLLTKVTRSSGPCTRPQWSPDGQRIAYTCPVGTDPSASNHEVFVATLGGNITSLTSDFDRCARQTVGSDSMYDGSVAAPVWSGDGAHIYFLATDRAQTNIYRVPSSGGPVKTFISVPDTTIWNFDLVDRAGDRPDDRAGGAPGGNAVKSPVICYAACTQLNPGDIYAAVGRDAGKRLTAVNDDLLGTIELSPHERFTYQGDGGWPIEGFIMKPLGVEPGKKYPIMVQIHGGPAATKGEAFNHESQLLAASGYGVFYMNFRGSKGYGQEFACGNVGNWGGSDYVDIMKGVDHICSLPWVDESRLFVTGASFGGFMTNWILGHTHRFRAAIAQASISNMYTKYGVSDIGWYGNKIRMGGADLWAQEDYVMSKSPIRYAPNVRTPVLILHAEDDNRCPMEQAEQWFVALKRLGNVEVEFVRFAGESHGMSGSGKPANRLERLRRMVEWWDRHNRE